MQKSDKTNWLLASLRFGRLLAFAATVVVLLGVVYLFGQAFNIFPYNSMVEHSRMTVWTTRALPVVAILNIIFGAIAKDISANKKLHTFNPTLILGIVMLVLSFPLTLILTIFAI